jgi:hypothetical protein
MAVSFDRGTGTVLFIGSGDGRRDVPRSENSFPGQRQPPSKGTHVQSNRRLPIRFADEQLALDDAEFLLKIAVA